MYHFISTVVNFIYSTPLYITVSNTLGNTQIEYAQFKNEKKKNAWFITVRFADRIYWIYIDYTLIYLTVIILWDGIWNPLFVRPTFFF